MNEVMDVTEQMGNWLAHLLLIFGRRSAFAKVMGCFTDDVYRIVHETFHYLITEFYSVFYFRLRLWVDFIFRGIGFGCRWITTIAIGVSIRKYLFDTSWRYILKMTWKSWLTQGKESSGDWWLLTLPPELMTELTDSVHKEKLSDNIAENLSSNVAIYRA